MSKNPLDDSSATYRVLENAEGQHSLWPSFAEPPAGWRVLLQDGTRDECLRYIESHWTDMKPRLRQA